MKKSIWILAAALLIINFFASAGLAADDKEKAPDAQINNSLYLCKGPLRLKCEVDLGKVNLCRSVLSEDQQEGLLLFTRVCSALDTQGYETLSTDQARKKIKVTIRLDRIGDDLKISLSCPPLKKVEFFVKADDFEPKLIAEFSVFAANIIKRDLEKLRKQQVKLARNE
jgi:hypothetical protein